MASPRSTPSTRLRTSLVLGLATVASLSVLPSGTGQAEPRPSLREVQQRVDALNAKVDDVNEQYAQSKIALDAATRTAAIAQSRVAAASKALDTIRSQMSSVAAAAYRTGGAGAFVQLVSTSTPQTFLDRASSLDRIAAGQSAELAAAATARHRLDAASQDAADAQSAQAAVARAMSRQKASIESALSEQEQLLGSLKAEERRAFLSARAARLAEASRLARASRSRTFESYTGPASGRAAIAVQEAYNKLGSPYQWAASGPDRFDCSGLTMWVWAKAGVSLSHSSQAQYGEGQHVSRGDLQPGDLTFYGSPIHHVGIYIGGGRMISAPHTGDVVKIQDAFRSDYVGAVRP